MSSDEVGSEVALEVRATPIASRVQEPEVIWMKGGPDADARCPERARRQS